MGGLSRRGKTNTYTSSDGGKTWIHFSDTVLVIHYDSTYSNQAITFDSKFIDAPILYDSSGIIEIIPYSAACISRDTGRNWSVWYTLPGYIETGFIHDIASSYVLRAYTYNGDWANLQMMASHDSCKNYQLYGKEFSVLGNMVSPCVIDSSNAWFALSKHMDPHYVLYHTTSGGENWDPVFIFDTTWIGNFYYYIVNGADKNTIYLVSSYNDLQILGQNYDFLYTTDNGNSWSGSWTFKGHLNWNGHYMLHNPRGTEVWCVLDDQHTIAYTSNNGAHWMYDSITFKSDSIKDMIWRDSVHAYVLGYKDSTISLYIYVPPVNHVELSLITDNTISIYPNPITSSASISYSLPTYQYIKLELIDQLGRVVRLFRSGSEDAGAKNISFSVSDLPSGMYYLRLQSDDGVKTQEVMVEK